MVRSHHPFGWFLVLVLTCAAYCLCLQQEAKNATKQVKNSTGNCSSPLPQRKINLLRLQVECNNIIELIAKSHMNMSAPTFCKQYENSTAPNVSAPVDRLKIPVVFPQNETSKAKIVVSDTLQDTLNLTYNSNLKKDNVNPTDTTDNETNTPTQTTAAANGLNYMTTNAENVASPNATENGNNTVLDPSKVDTEVGDMMDATATYSNPIHFPPVPFNFSKPPQGIDKETELIDDGQNTEDLIRNSSASEDQVDGPGVPLLQGQLAAILAGVFVGTSVIAYLGLLSWRRYLEHRYGNREMLVNEDEFNDDLRHFSI